MTEPERRADAPAGGPTPEEISARLEALLKRTHALRTERAAAPAAPLSITWPPPDRELDNYDVVDVPEDDRMQATPAPTRARPTAAPPAGPPATFARPDWSELRLRTPADEAPARSPWLGIAAGVLALVALAEGAYIWSLQQAPPAVAEGRLRVDAPEGAEIRVNGRTVGSAPIEHGLAPGDYDVEIAPPASAGQNQRVTISLGRTVVLLPAPVLVGPADDSAPGSDLPGGTQDAPAAATPTPATDVAPAAPPASTEASAAGEAPVSDTTGAVEIESTTPGLPVTMGGRNRGVTPITLGQVKPGRHDVLVGGLARQVQVQAGKVTTLRVPR